MHVCCKTFVGTDPWQACCKKLVVTDRWQRLHLFFTGVSVFIRVSVCYMLFYQDDDDDDEDDDDDDVDDDEDDDDDHDDDGFKITRKSFTN